MPKKIDLIGKRFGRLLVLKRMLERGKYREILWKCQCDCGNVIEASSHMLNGGYTLSCGCLNNENRKQRLSQYGYVPEVNDDGADERHILKAKTPKTNTSGQKGVSFLKDKNLWKAQICYGYKNYILIKSKDYNKCVAVRKAAEKAVENENFLQWLDEFRKDKNIIHG